MVKVSFRDTNMILTVKGLHKLWAFKSRLKIPIDQIVGASTDPEDIGHPKGLRAHGTRIPGLITAGTYRAKKKVFWDVCNKKKTIVIDLENNAYERLVVEVDDPQETVDYILKNIKLIDGGL